MFSPELIPNADEETLTLWILKLRFPQLLLCKSSESWTVSMVVPEYLFKIGDITLPDSN